VSPINKVVGEFEHIHNKAIFDTFNEALNCFRPYYYSGGPPYAWSQTEKDFHFNKYTESNIDHVLS